MHKTVLATLLLLTAAPAHAQSPSDLVSTTPTLTAEQQARADASLIQGIEILLSGKRTPALQPIIATMDIAAPPADVAQLKAGDNLPVFTRWLASRSAVLKDRAWDQGARWNQVLAAYRLANLAKDEAADATPITGDSFDDIYFLAYTLAMAGETQSATAYVKPFVAAADPQFEIAFATDLAGRVTSVDAFGGADKPKAAPLLAWALTQFDRPDARAPDALRRLHHADGEIRRMAGDIAGARAAYAKARKPGAPLDDIEVALMFSADDIDSGLRAIGATPGAPLSRAAADKLMKLTGYTGSGNDGTIAILRLTVPAYRRMLKLDDEPLRDAISQLAGALVEAGEPAQAEPLLAELFAYHERRFGFDTSGTNNLARRLAEAMVAQARYDEADLLYRRLWALVEQYQAYEDDAAQTYAQAIAQIMVARGRIDAALAFNGDALARARKAKAPDKGVLASYLTVQARLLAMDGKLQAAQAAAHEAVSFGPADDKLTIAAAFDNPDALARAQLASLLEAGGRAAEAEPIRRLLLRRIEDAPMISWEGDLRREAILALAANLTLQDKREGRALFGERLALNARIFGADSPQLLEVAEPFARALLRAGRARDALTPARAALAARTSSRFTGDAANLTQSDRALAIRRRDAAKLMVQAAWKAARPN